MIWMLIFIVFFYAILIISLSIGFRKVKEFSFVKSTPKTKFSIVIPFRNEVENLPILLESVAKLEYPKEHFEIILVDDFSEDNSVEIIKEFFTDTKNNIRIIKNNRVSNSPKKDAIASAIQQAKNDWIITTDADCKLPKKWLQTIDNFIQQQQPKMVVSPVNYHIENSFLHRFQLLDFLSLQASTIGGFGLNFPFLCNGANLAYRKDIFLQLNGFKNNNHIASGDDIFLFEKFLQHDKKSVQFLKSKDAMVMTFPVNSWKDLVTQRVRWASKTSNVNSVKVKLIGLLVFLTNASIVFSIFGFLFGINSFNLPFLLFAVKFIVDLFLFLPTVSFYSNYKSFMKTYALSCFLYPFFTIYVVLYSLFFSFTWKGRKFTK